jgi:hypothetical protein
VYAHTLSDPTFGELWVGDHRPKVFDHVFASIQSLNTAGLAYIDWDGYIVLPKAATQLQKGS